MLPSSLAAAPRSGQKTAMDEMGQEHRELASVLVKEMRGQIWSRQSLR